MSSSYGLDIATVPDGDKGDITVSASGATFTIDNAVVTLAKIQNAAASARLIGSGSSGSGSSYAELTLGTGLSMSGTTLNASVSGGGGLGSAVPVQSVRTAYNAFASGTTQIPADDTIPQSSEGDQYMSQAITPTNASNILDIEVVFFGSSSAAVRYLTVALFQDSGANAIAAAQFTLTNTNSVGTFPLSHRMVAGTTSATTFTVRAGLNSTGTTGFNGANSTRLLGDIPKSSIRITEILP